MAYIVDVDMYAIGATLLLRASITGEESAMGTTRRQTDKPTLKKHSAAIQLHTTLTLLQRKTWNVLLWHAYHELPTKEIHCIPLLQLKRLVGYDSKDEAYLKDATVAMMQCLVEWNVLGKDGAHCWGAAVLLASVQIEHGVCSYGFAPHLRPKLYNPEMFARLDLDLQKQFTSKYALALWELCTDYLGGKRDAGETPWIALADFRQLMGIAASMYTRYKLLSQRVLTPALAEINRVSDFRVTVAYQRQGRQITALKFQMRRIVGLPGPCATPPPVSAPDDLPDVVRDLQAAGLALHEAWDIWRQGFAAVMEDVRPAGGHDDADAAFAAYVREKIHLLKRRQAAGKVVHTTGFLREAIRTNYANPEYAAEQQREARRVERQTAVAVEHTRQALTQQQAALEARRDQDLQALCDRIAAEQPEVLEQAVAWALQEVPGFHLLYQRGQTALENYRDRVAMHALLHPYFERYAPACFGAVRARYATEIAALDQPLSALHP